MTVKHPHPPIRLRELRLAANLGAKQLAVMAGIQAWVIYQTEAGNCNPLLHKPAFKRVSKVLGVSLAEVLRPATEKYVTDKHNPVRAGHPNLPAVIKPQVPARRAPDGERLAVARRGRPPEPAAQGDVVMLSITKGGHVLGGIETRDLKAMRTVLRDLFGSDGDTDAG